MPLALTLGSYPRPVLRIECSKCGRAGRLNRDRLIAEHGPDIALPDLRHVLAHCPRRHDMGDPCAVVFPDLAQ